jgi:hypothetical protein
MQIDRRVAFELEASVDGLSSAGSMGDRELVRSWIQRGLTRGIADFLCERESGRPVGSWKRYSAHPMERQLGRIRDHTHANRLNRRDGGLGYDGGDRRGDRGAIERRRQRACDGPNQVLACSRTKRARLRFELHRADVIGSVREDPDANDARRTIPEWNGAQTRRDLVGEACGIGTSLRRRVVQRDRTVLRIYGGRCRGEGNKDDDESTHRAPLPTRLRGGISSWESARLDCNLPTD